MGKQGHGDCVYLAAGQLPRINGLLKVLVHGSVLRKLRRLAAGEPANAVRRRSTVQAWAVGDLLRHSAFGEGRVTHLFGSGEKVSIAVKFEGMPPKILDPRLAPIEPA